MHGLVEIKSGYETPSVDVVACCKPQRYEEAPCAVNETSGAAVMLHECKEFEIAEVVTVWAPVPCQSSTLEKLSL